MRIYTRTGDDGDTGLFGGGRVTKDDPRVEAYGEVDELNAVIGWARAVERMPRIDDVLLPIQRDLFSLGAILATPDLDKMHEQLDKARIDEARIAELERAIDDGETELEPLRAFILPGGTPKSAALHVARTVCRRAERRVVHLQRPVSSTKKSTSKESASKESASRESASKESSPSSTKESSIKIPPLVTIYLNRLSDLLFVLARVANRRAGAAELTW